MTVAAGSLKLLFVAGEAGCVRWQVRVTRERMQVQAQVKKEGRERGKIKPTAYFESGYRGADDQLARLAEPIGRGEIPGESQADQRRSHRPGELDLPDRASSLPLRRNDIVHRSLN